MREDKAIHGPLMFGSDKGKKSRRVNVKETIKLEGRMRDAKIVETRKWA